LDKNNYCSRRGQKEEGKLVTKKGKLTKIQKKIKKTCVTVGDDTSGLGQKKSEREPGKSKREQSRRPGANQGVLAGPSKTWPQHLKAVEVTMGHRPKRRPINYWKAPEWDGNSTINQRKQGKRKSESSW